MKNIIPKFKSFLPPGLVNLSGELYIVPGYIKVPLGTTLNEVEESWEKKEPEPAPGMYCSDDELEKWKAGRWKKHEVSKKAEIIEEVTSSKGDKKYLVTLHNGIWNCNCMGFSFHHTCRHVKEVQAKHNL